MQAFKRGWVEVVATPAASRVTRWTRDSDLELDLVREYGRFGLQSAIVVADAGTAKLKPEVQDPFYQALGQAMAQRISQGLIRHGEIVGVGSGRAVYNTVKALGRYAPLNIKDPTLVSLSGHAWSTYDRRPKSVDSDFNVTLFRECCPTAKTLFVNYPLTAGNSRQETLLDSHKWEKNSPNFALVGVGCLRPDHRFWPGDDLDHLLGPVRHDLETLAKLIRPHVDVGYFPVADVANHLVFVPHPDKSNVVSPAIAAEIARLNEKLLSVSDAQLKGIKSIALVAAERIKAFAIRELLVNPNYNVVLLCTDSATGSELVSLARQYPVEPSPEAS